MNKELFVGFVFATVLSNKEIALFKLSCECSISFKPNSTLDLITRKEEFSFVSFKLLIIASLMTSLALRKSFVSTQTKALNIKASMFLLSMLNMSSAISWALLKSLNKK